MKLIEARKDQFRSYLTISLVNFLSDNGFEGRLFHKVSGLYRSSRKECVDSDYARFATPTLCSHVGVGVVSLPPHPSQVRIDSHWIDSFFMCLQFSASVYEQKSTSRTRPRGIQWVRDYLHLSFSFFFFFFTIRS